MEEFGVFIRKNIDAKDNISVRLLGKMNFYAYELNKIGDDVIFLENSFQFFYKFFIDEKSYYINSVKSNGDFLNNILTNSSDYCLENPLLCKILFSYTKISNDTYYAPVIKFESLDSDNKSLLKTITLNFDILLFISCDDSLDDICKKFDREITTSLVQFKCAFNYYFNEMNWIDIKGFNCLHYLLNDKIYDIIVPVNMNHDKELFKDLATELCLSKDEISRSSSLYIPSDFMNKMTNNGFKLVCPHLSLKSEHVEEFIIQGRYTYYHYLQDGINDKGWGCAYRSLQTIMSWYIWQGHAPHGVDVPDFNRIKRILIEIGDRPESFYHSKSWIGSFEINLVLQTLLNIENRIIPLNKGTEISNIYSELSYHFSNGGAPVMIGGGELAHTIIGVAKDNNGRNKFLILDPHFCASKPSEPDQISEVLGTKSSTNWVGWKDQKFWKEKLPYNLCLPGLP